MELRHLRYFVAVAEERHFSRAAERLHISQPPLSRQIQDLERELRVELFHRHRAVELTDAGHALLDQARRTIEAADGFARTADRVADETAHTLRVGYPATAVVDTLPGSIERFREWCPDVAMDLVVGGSAQHLRDLQAGLVDAAVLRVAPGERIAMPTLPLEREQHVLLVEATHPLARRRVIARDHLLGVGLVVPARRMEPAIHDHLLADVFSAGEASPAIALEVTTLESLYGAVCAGFGIGISSWSSTRMLRTGDVVVRPLAEPAPVTDIVLAWSDRNVRRPLDAFLDVVAAKGQTSSHAPTVQPLDSP